MTINRQKSNKYNINLTKTVLVTVCFKQEFHKQKLLQLRFPGTMFLTMEFNSNTCLATYIIFKTDRIIRTTKIDNKMLVICQLFLLYKI